MQVLGHDGAGRDRGGTAGARAVQETGGLSPEEGQPVHGQGPIPAPEGIHTNLLTASCAIHTHIINILKRN